MRRSDQGNALFLILIAVALFAALSYAVTQSGRGGGSGVDSEKLSLAVAEFVQQATAIKTAVARLYIFDKVDQVRMGAGAYNAAGTVYQPDLTTATGRIVGLYNQDMTGLAVQYPPESVYATPPVAASQGWYYWYNGPMQLNGTHIGTSLGDEYLQFPFLSQEACEEINRQLYDDPSIPAALSGFGVPAKARGWQIRNGTFVNVATTAIRVYSVGLMPGCSSIGANYHYYEMIRAH